MSLLSIPIKAMLHCIQIMSLSIPINAMLHCIEIISSVHPNQCYASLYSNNVSIFHPNQCYASLYSNNVSSVHPNQCYASLYSNVSSVHPNQCYASLHSNIYEYMWSHGAGKVLHEDDSLCGRVYVTTKFYILRILVLVLFGMIWCSSFKTLLQGFDLYTMFFLHCKCSMSLGACTHHNVMEHSIEICLLKVQNEDTFMRQVQL